VDWIAKHPNLEGLECVRYHAVGGVRGALGEPKHVHLIITTEEYAEDRESGALEGRDSVEELPLQVMYRREPQVSTTPFLAAINLLKLLRSEGTATGPTFYRCHLKRVRQVAEEFEDSNIRWVLRA